LALEDAVKRTLIAAGAVLTLGLLLLSPRVRCILHGHCNPVRHPLGGFKCVDCGAAGADLEAMGFTGGAYVLPIRRLFSRGQGRSESTRTSAWEPGSRGM
jgi:hypothetical protein